MEQIVQDLLGGNRQENQNFVNQYEQGNLGGGVSNQEVQTRYRQVAGKVPPDVYQQAAMRAFEQLPPQRRQELVQQVQQHAQQRNVNASGLEGSSNNPAQFAQALTQMHQQNPGIVGDILSGVMGNSNSGLGKGLMAGIAAMAIKQVLNNR